MKRSTLLAVFALVLVASGCRAKEQQAAAAERPIPVEVFVAGQGPSGGEQVANGILEPVNKTLLSCTVGGVVERVYVEIGDRVRKGDALAALDLTDLRLGADQAEAAYQGAAIAQQTAANDYQRYSDLNKEGMISPADFEKATLGYKMAQHGLEQARAMREMAKKRLADGVVRAPFAGQITGRFISVGTYVDPMMHPVMFEIVDSSRLRVTLKLPEMRADLVGAGDDVLVKLPSLDKEVTTKIAVITDSVDFMTHTRTAIAWIENQGSRPLPGGIFFEARILPRALKGKIVVPATAVRRENDGQLTVFVVEKGRSLARTITGRFLPDRSGLIIDGGLATGERVALEQSMMRGEQAVSPFAGAAGPTAASDAASDAKTAPVKREDAK